MSDSPIAKTAGLPSGTEDGQTLRWEQSGPSWQPTSDVIIADGGNVGIGTTSPDTTLHINGVSFTHELDTGALDQKVTAWRAGASGAYTLQTRNDDYTAGQNAYQLQKGAGSVVDFHRWWAGGVERMRIASDGNVGIGTATPLATLDVFGDIRSTRSTARIQFKQTAAADLNFDMTVGAAGALAFRSQNEDFTAPIEHMRIDSTGNVGIGTTAPAAKLAVAGSGLFTGSNTSAGSGVNIAWTGTFGQVAGYDYDLATWLDLRVQGDAVRIQSDAETTFQTNTSERMRIDSAGNVGIGDTDPVNKLDVFGGNFRVRRDDNSPTAVLDRGPTQVLAGHRVGRILFRGVDEAANTKNMAQIAAHADELVTSTSYSGYMTFATAPTGSGSVEERMRITSGGNVGIGTPSPSVPLHVNGSGLGEQLRMDGSDTYFTMYHSGARRALFQTTGTGHFNLYSEGTGNLLLRSEADVVFQTGGGTEAMRIASDGNVGIGTTNPTTPLFVSGDITSTRIRLTSTSDASLTSTGHAFQIGATTGQNVIADGNELMARNNGAVSGLYLNNDGGIVTLSKNTLRADHTDRSVNKTNSNSVVGWVGTSSWGLVASSGAPGTGTYSPDWSVTRTSTGVYRLTFTTAATDQQSNVCVAVPFTAGNYGVSVVSLSSTQTQIAFYSTSGVATNADFSFIRMYT